MFRTYQQLFNPSLMGVDALIIALSFVLAWYIKFQSGWLGYGNHAPLRTYYGIMAFAVLTFSGTNAFVGLYKPKRAKSVWCEVLSVGKGTVIGMLIVMGGLYFVKQVEFSREVVFVFVVCLLTIMILERLTIRFVLRTMRSKGLNQKFILMLGWNQAANRFVQTLELQPWFGYRIIGYLSGSTEKSPLRGVECLGLLSDLESVLQNMLVDRVVIALPRGEFLAIDRVLSVCEQHGIQSLILPDYFHLLPARPRFETFGDIPLIDTWYVPLDDAMTAALKRTFDIVFSILVMLCLSPLYFAIAVIIKVTSPGAVFYVQERIGKNRRIFKMYKFRAMRTDVVKQDTEAELAEMWTVPNDPRRTTVGKFLRRTSLDELPQFWNVLIGDMSVIGPRPEQPHFVDPFREEIPRYMVKHRVRPGITGWAQVDGWRGDTSISERIQYDIEYIENWSFWMDIRIFVRTFAKGFVNPHAY